MLRAVLEHLDETAVRAAFAQPDHDGAFPPAFASYLRALAADKPSIILAFPPKAAGTFLRTAAIVASDGQLIRIVHAQGGRDAQPYLPVFLSYYRGLIGSGTLVAHAHMQALPANRHFLEALDLKPIIMVRPIPDMLASYRDMLDAEAQARREGLNCPIPPDYPAWPEARKSDFLVDVIAPWYAGYYASWFDYAKAAPARVCVLTYDELLEAPAATLARVLEHSRIATSGFLCRKAVESAWAERHELRFNRGEAGRGTRYFDGAQIARLRRMLSYYPELSDRIDALL
jgi:hypothetical protein